MPPSDNFNGLTLRISAKKLGVLCVSCLTAFGGIVTAFQTKQTNEIDRRLTAIEAKLEIILPRVTVTAP